MACCGPRWLRGALLVEAVLELIGGVLLIVIGGDALTADGTRAAVLVGVLLARGAAWMMVIAGSLLVLLAALGGIGAALHNRCLTVIFCCVAGLLLLLTVLTAVTAMVVTGPASDKLEVAMFRSMAKYGNDTHVTNAWDMLQSGFHCCGVDSGVDWARNGSLSTAVPWSCCRRFTNGTEMPCEELPSAADSFFMTGCLTAARRLLKSAGWVIGGVTIAVTALLLLSIVAGGCLVRYPKKETIYEQIHHK